MKRIYSYLLALLALGLALNFYMEWSYLGFPDGHLTEYDEAIDKLYPVYSLIHVLFAALFIYIARNRGKASLKIKPIFALLVWIAFVGIGFLLDNYLYLNLEHGQGG